MTKKTRVHFEEGNAFDSFDVDANENKEKQGNDITLELDKRKLNEDKNGVWTEEIDKK